MHDCHVKMPNFAFYLENNDQILFLFLNVDMVCLLESTSRKVHLHLTTNWVGIIAIKTERMLIHFRVIESQSTYCFLPT